MSSKSDNDFYGVIILESLTDEDIMREVAVLQVFSKKTRTISRRISHNIINI